MPAAREQCGDLVLVESGIMVAARRENVRQPPGVGPHEATIRYKRAVPPDRSASILVVEDDAAMRELLTEELSDAGFTVHSAASATTGLEIARSAKFDLVVTD